MLKLELRLETPRRDGMAWVGMGLGMGMKWEEEHLLVHVMCYGPLSPCRRRCPPAAFLVLQLQEQQHRNSAATWPSLHN